MKIRYKITRELSEDLNFDSPRVRTVNQVLSGQIQAPQGNQMPSSNFPSSSSHSTSNLTKRVVFTIAGLVATITILKVLVWLYDYFKKKKDKKKFEDKTKNLSESYIIKFLREDAERPWYEVAYQDLLIPFITFMKTIFKGVWWIIRGMLKIISWIASKLSYYINKFLDATDNKVEIKYEETVDNILKLANSSVLRDKMNGIENVIPKLDSKAKLMSEVMNVKPESQIIPQSGEIELSYVAPDKTQLKDKYAIVNDIPDNYYQFTKFDSFAKGLPRNIIAGPKSILDPSKPMYSVRDKLRISKDKYRVPLDAVRDQWDSLDIGRQIDGLDRGFGNTFTVPEIKLSEISIRKVINGMVNLINAKYPHLSVTERAYIMKDALKNYVEAVIQNQPQQIPQPGITDQSIQQNQNPNIASTSQRANAAYIAGTGDSTGIANPDGTLKQQAVTFFNSPQGKKLMNATGDTNLSNSGNVITNARADIRTANANRISNARAIASDPRGNLSTLIQ